VRERALRIAGLVEQRAQNGAWAVERLDTHRLGAGVEQRVAQGVGGCMLDL